VCRIIWLTSEFGHPGQPSPLHTNACHDLSAGLSVEGARVAANSAENAIPTMRKKIRAEVMVVLLGDKRAGTYGGKAENAMTRVKGESTPFKLCLHLSCVAPADADYCWHCPPECKRHLRESKKKPQADKIDWGNRSLWRVTAIAAASPVSEWAVTPE
jgi:hypothetical protein